MPLPALATPADVRDFGYDIDKVSPLLYRASTRVRGYLRHRRSAAALWAATPLYSPELAEVVCTIANRIASTPASLIEGIRSEGVQNEQITWGAEAAAGTTSLLPAERAALDGLYPRRGGTIFTDPM